MHRVLEGVQHSATFAEIILRVDVVDQMAAPTGAAIESVVDITTGESVKSTVMPSGAASIENTTFVKFPSLKSLTVGHEYSIRFSFSDADNKLPGEVLVDTVF